MTWYVRQCAGGCGREIATRAKVARAWCTSCHPDDLPISPSGEERKMGALT